MQNYHCHHHFSNVFTPFKDSAMGYEDYAKRAVELGQQVLSSVDHGYQGNYLRCWETAQKYGLKYVYGVEAYWVKDRKQDDRTNAHIVILSQNLEGIYQINEMLSQANIDGYYSVPRVDAELMKTLDPKNVLITTACVAFWGKVDRETQQVRWHYSDENNSNDEILRLFDQICTLFNGSVMLEVQSHNTPWQKEINKLCVNLHYRRGIPLIAGLDSHYVYPAEREERLSLREESGVKMADEDHEFSDGVYEDYPDEQTVIERFRTQGVLSEDEIREAIENTDITLMFNDIVFDRSRKLPSALKYRNLSQEEKNQIYLGMIQEGWNRYKQNVPQERWAEYEKSFYEEEVKMVLDEGMADYFLLDHDMVEEGIRNGGMITPSGRGSSGSWFTNTLLGFSTLDRFNLPVELYPARFCTAERLKTSCPDLDLNLDEPEIFAAAQAKLMGERSSFPMIAYGTLKQKAAFKMYARSKNLPAEEANAVSKQIGEYEEALKNADDEEERELIDIEDYVDAKYMPYIEGSQPYKDIVVSKSQAPCAYMVYNGDIMREVGILRINADGGKKIVYCTVIDGYTAEAFGYVKNDLLKVATISISAKAMKKAGLPNYTSRELIELTRNDPETWEIFAKGWTQGINQCQGTGTTEKLKVYKPKCLQDLSAFVAAIRPGFKSMAGKFLRREPFSYHVPSFDALLQNDSSKSSWLIYQENIMKCLAIAGFEMEETYPQIKAISKKKLKVINASRDRFIENFKEHVAREEGLSGEESLEVVKKVWQIILDSSKYLFNAAHAVAVAIDALYGAYLKAHYPLEYYSVLLDASMTKGDKNKISKIKEEMKQAFGIRVVPCRFRQDNRQFSYDSSKMEIMDALHSIKHIGRPASEALYALRNSVSKSFIDLLCELDNIGAVKKSVIFILIRLGYFEEFGSPGRLMAVFKEFYEGKNRITKQLKSTTREKRLECLKAFEQDCPESNWSMEERVSFEAKAMGIPLTVVPDAKNQYVALEVNTKYGVKVWAYSLRTGVCGTFKFRKRDFNDMPIRENDVFLIRSFQKREAVQYVDGKRTTKRGVYDWWCYSYSILYREEES